MSYATKSTSAQNSIPNFWIPKTKLHEIAIDDLHSSSYLLINAERMGFYRVQYDEANWLLLSNELSLMDPFSNISPISRAMLINDAGVFLMKNMIRARVFFELMKHLEHDVRIKNG